MKIGELSRRSGISIRMLRYYEAEGLLQPARTAAGYREYGPEAEEELSRIGLLRAAGLTLDKIRQLQPCLLSRQRFVPCDTLRQALGDELRRLDGRIEALAQSRRMLAGFLDGLPAEAAGDGRAA